MSKKKFIADFFRVFASNAFVLLSSVCSGFIVPKILGVSEYGIYKTFMLYMGYTALLHFGFVDGILLIHAGQQYEAIDKRLFCLNTKLFIFFQLGISILVFVAANMFFSGPIREIANLMGIDFVIVNVTTYYQSVSQCTMRFKELSIRKVLQAILKLLIIVFIWVLDKYHLVVNVSANLYIGSIIISDLILLVWYIFSYRDITFGKSTNISESYYHIRNYFKYGISLTIAYQVANLILNLDRQFVSLLFNNEVFAAYAFAYTLIGMVTTIANSFSLVLFPNLKQKNEKDMMSFFADGIALVLVVVFATHIGFCPLSRFILWFLPSYGTSVSYLKVIFPSLALSACINTIIFTYFKAINKSQVYFWISVCVLLLSGVLNAGAYALYKSPEAISCASIVVLFIWYVVGQGYFVKKYNVKWKRNFIYIVLQMVGFYSSVYLFVNDLLGMITYILFYVVVTAIMYREVLNKNIRFKRNR